MAVGRFNINAPMNSRSQRLAAVDRSVGSVLTAVVVLHAALLGWGACRHSPTWNEPEHLVAGISHWRFGRFDLFRVNPPLVRMVSCAPLMLLGGFDCDWSRYDESAGVRSERVVRKDFVAANGGRLLGMVTVARWGAIPFSLLGAYVCFRWAKDLYGRVPGVLAASRSRPLFLELKKVLRGLAHWDRFEHEKAWNAWAAGGSPSMLSKLASVGGYVLVEDLARKCQPMIAILGPLAKNWEEVPHKGADRMVLDMLANADRSAGRGNHDEAALRYYRAVELCVSRRLKVLYSIDNDAVAKDQVPSPMKEELVERKGEPGRNGWELAQYNSIKLLAVIGDPAGQRLLDRYDRKRIDSQARNKNWLIHGQQHVSQSSCESFRTAVLDALDISPEEIPAWPDFRA